MSFALKQVEVLVRRALAEARKAVDVPAIQDILYRIPGGQVIRTMIGQTMPTPVKFEPSSVNSRPPEVPLLGQMATTTVPAPAQTTSIIKEATPAVATTHAAMHPVPVGTRARILTGAFTGWTGPLQWSPAKGVYNVRLTGHDGQKTRTTLSPSRLGTSWEVESKNAQPRAAKQKRKEAQA
jgi:hypothetical protein